MIFDNIKTEHDVECLKKRVIKNDKLFSQIERIREQFRVGEVSNDGTNNPVFARKDSAHKMPTNSEMMSLYNEMLSSGEKKKIKM